MNKLFLVGMLLVSPLQAQEIYSENEWSIVSQFCSIGPPIVCQIEADSLLSPRAVRELEIMFLEFSNTKPPDSALQSADSLMQEIVWRVEFIAEINEKYGGDNTTLDRLIVRLKRAQGWVRKE